MTQQVCDITSYHFGIEDIRRNTVPVEEASFETSRQQTAMLGLWNCHREDFRRRLFMPPEALRAWQLRKLARLVDWAFTTSPFYRRRYQDAGFELGGIRSFGDFEALPQTTREDVIAGFPVGLPSLAFDSSSCRLAGSSGSSGRPVQVVEEQHRADLDTLFKYRMFEYAGDCRLAEADWIYNVHQVPWWHTSMAGHYRVFTVSQACPAHAVLEHIALLRPKIVSCAGAYLAELASESRAIAGYGVALVNTNSEPTSRLERTRSEAILGVPVRDEYSSEEIDLLAVECSARHYHAVEDNAYLEIVDADADGIGNVIATDLWNHAMPMIRYEQGDLAAWSCERALCSCGSHFRRIAAINGRANDAFRTRGGSIVASADLLGAIEECLCLADAGLADFRVIQMRDDLVELIFVRHAVADNFDDAIFRFAAALSSLFGYHVTVRAMPVLELPRNASYKRKTLICRMEEPA
jgi:phenylacetate-CoA ligase